MTGLPFFQGKTDFGLLHPVAKNWVAEHFKENVLPLGYKAFSGRHARMASIALSQAKAAAWWATAAIDAKLSGTTHSAPPMRIVVGIVRIVGGIGRALG